MPKRDGRVVLMANRFVHHPHNIRKLSHFWKIIPNGSMYNEKKKDWAKDGPLRDPPAKERSLS